MAAQVRVKICGITSVGDAQVAVAAGADAIGLVFYPASPRFVDAGQARAIAECAGPFTTVVGLFVDAGAEFVGEVLSRVPLHLLQFHGGEARSYCEQFRRPYLKALRMKADLDIGAAMAEYGSAAGILLDAYREGVPGGTGETFDWARVPRQAPAPLVLAGGLNCGNVERAIAATRPYAVDVSGGVESAPGRKDPRKVADFVAAARQARSF